MLIKLDLISQRAKRWNIRCQNEETKLREFSGNAMQIFHYRTAGWKSLMLTSVVTLLLSIHHSALFTEQFYYPSHALSKLHPFPSKIKSKKTVQKMHANCTKEKKKRNKIYKTWGVGGHLKTSPNKNNLSQHVLCNYFSGVIVSGQLCRLELFLPPSKDSSASSGAACAKRLCRRFLETWLLNWFAIFNPATLFSHFVKQIDRRLLAFFTLAVVKSI